MLPFEMLLKLRSSWLAHAVELSRQKAFSPWPIKEEDCERFFDVLCECLLTGEGSPMQRLIDSWLERAESELLNSQELDQAGPLVAVVDGLWQNVLDVALEHLAPEDTAQLIEAVKHLFSHAIRYAARADTAARMHRLAEEEKTYRRELQRLDHSRSTFIHLAAHELRTPLTLVEGYAEMLREELDPGGQDSGLLLEGILTGARRMRRMIDNLIDISLVDNQMLALHYEPVRIGDVLVSAERSLRAVIKEKRLTFDIRQFEGSEAEIFADRERLAQALIHVLQNAIQYTPEGGSIVVDGRTVPGFIEMTISDTGVGIAPEDQQWIFDAFAYISEQGRYDGRTRLPSSGHGTGLGLHLARGILEAHGGAIWVESPGHDEKVCPGSTFHFMIPLRDRPPDDLAAKLFGPKETGPSR